jgi:integrase
MPRLAKPFLERDHYISRAGGGYIKLWHRSEGMAKAKALLRDHLKRLEQEKEHNGGRVTPGLTVSELFALFLEATEAEKSKDTFHDYQRWCVEFAKLHGKRKVRDLTRLDGQKFKQHMLTATWVRKKQAPQPYKPKSINHAIIALRRAFNWAIDNELLPEGRNPFARVKLEHCEGRKRVATPEEFKALLENCTDDHFRDVLIAMRYTPARPGDIRNLTWPMVKWDRHCWEILKHKTSRTAKVPKPFIVGMHEVVEKMLRERQAKYGQAEWVFLNEEGKPWTKNALGLRMRRLRKRAGIQPDERGEYFVLYTNRHTFLSTAGMDASIPDALRTEVANHTDGRTTQLYTHLRDDAVAEAGRRVADSLRAQDTPGK